MKIFCGGVRGTETITDASCAAFGGDTTSFRIEHSSGDFIILDLGTGIRSMEGFLEECCPSNIKILMTHYHLDHLNGVPKFQALYDPEVKVHIRGPVLNGHSCQSAFQRVFSSPLWPIPFRSLQENQYETLPGGEFSWGGFKISSCKQHHFEGSMAYRFEEEGGGPAAVIATDIDWGKSTADEQRAFLAFCKEPAPAKMLIFDGQMTPQNYLHFEGWGHSTWQQALEVAQATGVEQLMITHHAPQHDDETLRALEEELQRVDPAASFARQGQTVFV